MKTSGYSSTPLAKKLGIKENFSIKLVNEPEHYFRLLADLPTEYKLVKDSKTKVDFIHYFTTESTKLLNDLPKLKQQLLANGMIWVSWPKKTSKVETDVNENIIRDLALSIGLVDIKVCAVDEVWSGLKLVIPVKDRK